MSGSTTTPPPVLCYKCSKESVDSGLQVAARSLLGSPSSKDTAKVDVVKIERLNSTDSGLQVVARSLLGSPSSMNSSKRDVVRRQ